MVTANAISAGVGRRRFHGAHHGDGLGMSESVQEHKLSFAHRRYHTAFRDGRVKSRAAEAVLDRCLFPGRCDRFYVTWTR